MKVELKSNWFAPTDPMGDSLSKKSGQFFRKGVHNIDIRWKKNLPKDSVILDAPVIEDVKAPVKSAKIKKEA